MRTWLIFFIMLFAQPAYEQSQHPNIILLMADDLGYGDLGCYGQKKIETPNLDKLAAMGIKFNQFYSGSTVCAPARCALMTGMHTGHSAVRGNVTLKPEGQFPLPDSSVTFPMLLQKAGYITAAFGKWSLGFITGSGDPAKKGFDEFFGYNCQTLAHNYYPDHLWHDHDRVELKGNMYSDSVYSADLIHQQAMNFLRIKKDRPFFLYLPYTLPHADVIVPHDKVYDHYVKKFNEPPVPLPKAMGEDKSHFDPYPHAAYAAMVARLDRYVGEIMQLLKEQGIEKNTLIVFTSDNGPHKEKGGDPVFFNSSGGLRGIKRDLYEGGIRVPFIAYQKGITKAGSRSQPAALWDLFPTFLELAGVTITEQVDGISILPALKGQPQTQHRYLYWELHESGGKQALRMGKWKAVKLNLGAPVTSQTELYDLEKDPGEKKNVATLYPEVVKQAETLFYQAYRPNRNWPLFYSEKK